MLTIKLIDDCVTPKGFGNVGDVMELSDDDAKLLIRAGRAIIAPTPILETTSSSEESTATTTRSTRKGGR